MTIYQALEGITFPTTFLRITVNTADRVTDRITYTYSDGDRLTNSLAIFLSYHAHHIRLVCPDIAAEFPEYFI